MGLIVQMKETFNEYVKQENEEDDETIAFFSGKRKRSILDKLDNNNDKLPSYSKEELFTEE
jgi:hypothetical protein